MQVFFPVLFLAALTSGEVMGSKFSGPTAVPVVLNNGYLADTHEVAAAKSAHLATLSHQSYGGSYAHHADTPYTQRHGDLSYHGYSTLPLVQQDGHIADTHEVAAAKAEHYAAVAKARAHGGYHYGGDYSSNAGHVADTPEVAAAKAEHYAAVAKARAHGGYHYGGDYSSNAGHIADTPEVAAAKAEHYAAVAKARSLGGYPHAGAYYSGQYSGASGAPHWYGTHSSYYGALASPVVLPSGYLADTVEVANAKQQHYHLVHSSQSKHHY